MLSVVQVSWGPPEPGNAPGTVVLLLFIVALTAVAVGQYLVPATLRYQAIRSLSALVQGSQHQPKSTSRHADKRAHLRRDGETPSVSLSNHSDGTGAESATVLNRSRKGLLLAVDRKTERGEICYVLPPNPPVDLEWVRLEVRYCRFQDGRWLWGCKFTKELPWGIILMFG